MGSFDKKLYDRHLADVQTEDPKVDLILDVGSGDMAEDGEDWRIANRRKDARRRRKKRGE